MKAYIIFLIKGLGDGEGRLILNSPDSSCIFEQIIRNERIFSGAFSGA